MFDFENLTIQTFDDSEERKANKTQLKSLAQIFPYNAPGSEERIQELQSKGAGTYFAANPQIDGFHRDVEHTAWFKYLRGDLDVAKEKENLSKDQIETEKQRLINKLKKLPLPPYGVINTKNGLQPDWRFSDSKELKTKAERIAANEEYKKMVAAVTKVLGRKSEGDSICRAVRLPGTKHLKTSSDPYEITYQDISGQECTFAEFYEAYPSFESQSDELKGKFDPAILAGVEDGSRTNDAGTYIGYKLENLKRLDDKAVKTSWMEIKDWNLKNKPPKDEDDLKDFFEDILEKERSKRLDKDTVINKAEIAFPDPINEAAYHGLVGKFIKLVEPQTEADVAGLIAGFLTFFSNVIGRSAYVLVGPTKHYLKCFCLLCGVSAKARKGLVEDEIRRIFQGVDSYWEDNCIASGLSSGEGVVSAVRDKITKLKDGEEITVDDGVDDKRLLIIEGEFVSPLKQTTREGNILSPTIRNAWDDKMLRTLTKNSPLKATNSHISIFAHITPQELVKYLADVELSNGFANRFLIFLVRRSRELPFGGNVPQEELSTLQNELKETVELVKLVHLITFSPEGAAAWRFIYHYLTAEVPGLAGSLTARTEAYALRLAGIYALLDKSVKIEVPHIRAALAILDYTNTCVRYIFKDQTGDQLANQVLELLKESPKGLARTQISDTLGRNYEAVKLTLALDLLLTTKKISKIKSAPNGRSKEVYMLNSLSSSSPASFLQILDEKLNEFNEDKPISEASIQVIDSEKVAAELDKEEPESTKVDSLDPEKKTPEKFNLYAPIPEDMKKTRKGKLTPMEVGQLRGVGNIVKPIPGIPENLEDL